MFARGLLASIRRIYPQLPRFEIDYLWSGTFGRTLHHMPQIGEVGRGVWVASGFGTHGLNTSALAGELIARGIVESDQTWRLFAPYELVWAGGKMFRAAAQAMYLVSRPAAALREAWARRRERSRRRREVRAQERRDAIAARSPAPAAPGVSPAPSPPPAQKKRPRRGKTAASLPVPAPLEGETPPSGKL
jgi:hypothetical protein